MLWASLYPLWRLAGQGRRPGPKEYPRTRYQAQPPDGSLRAKRDQVMQVVERGGQNLVDVRSRWGNLIEAPIEK